MSLLPPHRPLTALVLVAVLLACSAAGMPAPARPRLAARPVAHPPVAAMRRPAARVSVHIPAAARRPSGERGIRRAKPAPPDSIAALQETLSRLGYLPVRWSVRDRRFAWRWRHVPAALRRLWTPGAYGPVTRAAVVQFLRVSRLTIPPRPGPALAHALGQARADRRTDPYAYTYVLVSQRLPETLNLWRGGRVVLSTPVNTGEAPTTTAVGSFAVYLRYRSQQMRGTGPDGRPYDYPHVMWVSYFHGGDAIHAFPRASYGFPQSAGCVELPPPVAETVWKTIHYGTLVTILPPGARPRDLPGDDPG